MTDKISSIPTPPIFKGSVASFLEDKVKHVDENTYGAVKLSELRQNTPECHECQNTFKKDSRPRKTQF